MQISELEEWLKSEGKSLSKGDYVADVGFQWCRDAGGGGSALSPESMKVMGELGISLFLSEYPGFSDETEESEFLFEVHQPPNKSVQPTPGSVTPRASEGTSK